jgi:2-polyprenyl-3-methyl-5-hydroxy-6-metoxy-1,4-benzoquinol methylase
MTAAPYFANHDRRGRFPWSLYHRELERRVADVVRSHGPGARVATVGCGLDPLALGADEATSWACDLDAVAVAECQARFPRMAPRIAVCPGPYELPSWDGVQLDVVIAKEVIEHVDEPPRFARALSRRLAPGGSLVLTTPNYGRGSTLALLERTVLEWVARREGWSRADIHPSRFDRQRLATLDVGPGVTLESLAVTRTGWALVAVFRRGT